jgi:ribosomal protein S16
VVLDKPAVEKYLNNGAQPSSRVVRILEAEKIKLPDWVKQPTKLSAKAKHADKLRKNQPKEEPVVEVPAEAEAPATEAAVTETAE